MNIKRKLVERVRITGPAAEGPAMYAYCDTHGYTVIYGRSGYLRGRENARPDLRRYGVTGEREVVVKE